MLLDLRGAPHVPGPRDYTLQYGEHDIRHVYEERGRAQSAAARVRGEPLVHVPDHRQHDLPGLGMAHLSGVRDARESSTRLHVSLERARDRPQDSPPGHDGVLLPLGDTQVLLPALQRRPVPARSEKIRRQHRGSPATH